MEHDRNSPKYQRAVDSFVRQNVSVCLSPLVATLANTTNYECPKKGSQNAAENAAHYDLCIQAQELSAPVLDYEEAARQAGWSVSHSGEKFVDGNGNYCDDPQQPDPRDVRGWENLCNAEGIDPYEWEIFEHWSVSEWLAERLEAKGERVDRDFAGLCVWGRTCTGQSIASDDVICQIYDEMMGAV